MHEILSIDQLDDALSVQGLSFRKTPYRSYEQRISDLKNLKKMLLDNQQDFIDAMSSDFGHRSEDDSIVGDILTSVSGINYSIKHLKSWMKPKRKHIGLLFQPASGKVIQQPLGVVGIIAPWNYPIFLSVGPLTAALAAGNNAMIKMSEFTPKTSLLLAELLANYFPKDKVAVVAGDVKIAAAFSCLKFDHLFYTGSTTVGKLVMKAAAENLVPVTLELGGKSPSIIDEKMDMKTTVSRFILAKTLNSGQTCVAPDYLLCPREKVNELILELKKLYLKMYPTITDNMDCTSIVNQAQYARLKGLLEDAKDKGASLIPLSYDEDNDSLRRMPLTLLLDTTDEMKVMQQEIFGPILPIVAYDTLDQAIDYVNDRPRPLALYIFSFDKQFQQKILLNTHAGGVCINDAAFHVANDDLPFGGIGPSGMGSYHGDEGFKTFSHAKSVLTRGKINLAPLLFPPYGKMLHKMIYKFFIR
ncbi:MAG: coniferyl-aldehyde dehydrogenase [Gammaproteobacteria bacterium]|nr:MAG: coniferyl-aldehyde dehydrogenase [Gammaproteobacteria bacterium]